MNSVTYMSIEAQMEDISRQSRDATTELEAMLERQPEPITIASTNTTVIPWGWLLAGFVGGLGTGMTIAELFLG